MRPGRSQAVMLDVSTSRLSVLPLHDLRFFVTIWLQINYSSRGELGMVRWTTFFRFTVSESDPDFIRDP